jgi:soluble lytic murein transglycosylase-like protein
MTTRGPIRWGRRCGLLLLLAVLAAGCSIDTGKASPVPVGERALLAPVGAALPSDDEAAARVRRSGWEPRPGNETANHTVPSPSQLAEYRSRYVSDGGSRRFQELKARVSGDFTGTTDEIIQWVAWKWGLPVDVIRAEAVDESDWDMQAVGDRGRSFGIMQIKDTAQPGTYPMSRTSTAFNLDHYGFVIRAYYEDVHPWLRDIEAGDYWGAIGAWWSGSYRDPGAEAYIDRVKEYLERRDWEKPGF